MPGEMPPASDLLAALDHASGLAKADFGQAGRALCQGGNRPIGLFLTRWYRAGVSEDELRLALKEFAAASSKPIKSLGDRLGLARRILAKRAVPENAALYCFKYASAAARSMINKEEAA